MAITCVLKGILWSIAVVAACSALYYPIQHIEPAALPTTLSEPKNDDLRLQTADSVRDVTSYLVTIAFGLAAAVAFSLRNGLGKNSLIRALNASLLGIFMYFLSRTVVLAYDALRIIIVQLDRGHLYLSFLDPVIEKQGNAVFLSALTALILLGLNLATHHE